MSRKETLEEAFYLHEQERYNFPILDTNPDLESAKFGAKWQEQRMYSKEEMEDMYNYGYNNYLPVHEAFKQFKNK